jgi:hypothetical protein
MLRITSPRSRRQRIAGFLAAVSLCIASSGVAAAQSPIRDCLQGWDIALKLPYFPRYVASGCERFEAPGKAPASRYFSAAVRSTRLRLGADINALRSPADANDLRDLRLASLSSSFAHFDALFASQGFTRIALGENVEADARAAYRSGATYEAVRGNARLRITLAWDMLTGVTLELQSVAALKDGVALPTPAANFRFHEAPAKLAELFRLPGAELVSDAVQYHDQRAITITNPALRERAGGDGEMQLFLPEHVFVYRFPKDTAEQDAAAALSEALRRAGWTSEPGGGAIQGLRASYAAQGRRIAMNARVYWEGAAMASVRLIDPLFQERQGGVQASLESLGQYTFAPSWAGGSLDEDSDLRLAAALFFLASRAARESNAKFAVEVLPVASGADASPALRMAAQARDELVRRGWESARVWLADKPVPPGTDTPGLAAGVRLTPFECRTRSEDLPGGRKLTCTCTAQGRPAISQPGQCT